MAGRNTLVVLPPVPGVRTASGTWLLPEKFVTGIAEIVKGWNGKVHVVLNASASPGTDLDVQEWRESALPCTFEATDFSAFDGLQQPDQCVVLLFPNHRLHRFFRSCKRAMVPVTLVVELSLRTQLAIARVRGGGLVARAKAAIWLVIEHLRWLRAATSCYAVQCNGVPVYRAYEKFNSRTMFFFDSRITASVVADEESISRKYASSRQRGYPRLLFSGRLISIKGVDDLIDTAEILRDRGFRFELLIAGDGDRRKSMQEAIDRRRLATMVKLIGVLDFRQQLTPLLVNEIDLFVCTHVQGDPSCTYLETMAAGVPIVGYDNEALQGVVDISGSGWLVRMREPELLADRIVQIWSDKESLISAARSAATFASRHSFEAEFARRVGALQSSAD